MDLYATGISGFVLASEKVGVLAHRCHSALQYPGQPRMMRNTFVLLTSTLPVLLVIQMGYVKPIDCFMNTFGRGITDSQPGGKVFRDH